MLRALVIAAALAFAISAKVQAQQIQLEWGMPEYLAARTCSTDALRRMALDRLDPPEVIAQASYDACAPLWERCISIVVERQAPFLEGIPRSVAAETMRERVRREYLFMVRTLVAETRAHRNGL
jgi:hypothetical protein